MEELADLEALNKQLAKKGGAVVGINSFTLDGDKTAISDAKNILAKKDVTYKTFGLIQKVKPENSHPDCTPTPQLMLSIKTVILWESRLSVQ